jgi:hypothetical protein
MIFWDWERGFAHGTALFRRLVSIGEGENIVPELHKAGSIILFYE